MKEHFKEAVEKGEENCLEEKRRGIVPSRKARTVLRLEEESKWSKQAWGMNGYDQSAG